MGFAAGVQVGGQVLVGFGFDFTPGESEKEEKQMHEKQISRIATTTPASIILVFFLIPCFGGCDADASGCVGCDAGVSDCVGCGTDALDCSLNQCFLAVSLFGLIWSTLLRQSSSL